MANAQNRPMLGNANALEGMVKVWLALAARHGRSIGFSLTQG